MKIGIVGPAERSVAWEKHLRPHQSVSEVIIAASLKDLGKVDACFLLDESGDNLDHLLKAVRVGLHTFLISPLPTGREKIEKVYHAAEEANILLQFSHWPSLAPASQWMYQKIAKPRSIQIIRQISHTRYMEMEFDLEYYWVDELAYALKWINGNVHQLDTKQIKLKDSEPIAIQLYLRFDSGATAGIFVNIGASENHHQRIAADDHFILECDVQHQSVRWGQVNPNGHLFFERKEFDAAKSAELAAVQFLKAIQLNRPTLYNSYHLLQLSSLVEKVRQRLKRF